MKNKVERKKLKEEIDLFFNALPNLKTQGWRRKLKRKDERGLVFYSGDVYVLKEVEDRVHEGVRLRDLKASERGFYSRPSDVVSGVFLRHAHEFKIGDYIEYSNPIGTVVILKLVDNRDDYVAQVIKVSSGEDVLEISFKKMSKSDALLLHGL